MAGTVGAMFNCALQLGAAVGISAVSSIETSIEEKDGDPTGYRGRAAAFWFMLGVICVEALSVVVFYRIDIEKVYDDKEDESEKEGDWKRSSVSIDQEFGIAEEPKLSKDDGPDPARVDSKHDHDEEKGVREEVREEPVV